MTSRKEEERNEKIIRGLLKLPPNRRCINCNSLGPQYVCTNFWTFVCITCSGIHREFTHRVKSVSMAKFTSQEVEALQKGGNQRAKEIYLKDWDAQRQRLPDSSNVDRVREFIKNVYVDRRYAGGKTSDKPPRDVQSLRNCEDETRRASSYHSYSQSPPYDYQYEDRRFGKQAAVLTRKPGSDRGHYEGKISSFVYSPGRLSDQMYEDRFANEGSVSRVSDYSVSSRGDPFRSGTQSPNFQKDVGFSSPPIQPSRDILIEDLQHQTLNTCSETNIKRGSDWISRPQRTASSGSFGSFDSTLISLKSVNSGSLKDFVSEPEQSAGTHQDKMSTFPSLLQSSFSGNTGKLDLFEPLVSPPVTSSASSIDLFQFPLTSSASPVDLFQPSLISSVSSVNMCQLPQTTIPPPLDFFSEIAQELPAATLDNKSPELSVPKNEGWATFDIPQPMTSTPGVENLNPVKITSGEGDSLGKFGPTLSSNKSMQWPSFQNFSAHGPSSSISNAWHEGLQNVQASTNPTSTQSWNAFEDSIGPLPWESIQKSSEPQVAAYKPPSIANQHLGLKVLEDSDKDVFQRTTSDSGHSLSSLPSHVVNGPSNTQLALPLKDTQSHATDHKSINPFDLPYDSDMELRNMFLDMSPLQGALPNAPLSSSFLGGVTQPWFPQNPVTPYIPAAPQAYMVGQATASQLQNVPTQGSVASIGGNPFA